MGPLSFSDNSPRATAPGKAGERMSKSEREKMLAGELYLASDEELREARLRARGLVKAFNDSEPTDAKRRADLLSKLLGAVGEGAEIEPPFHCDYGVNIRIGERFFANFGCVILDCAEVSIGARVIFAPYVQLYTATHPLDPAVRAQGLELAKPIVIEDDVWIGGGAIVLPGVRIGRGAVIGVGSVVSRDVPPMVLAVGNPCRVVRELSSVS